MSFRGCPSIVFAVLAATASPVGGPGTWAAPSSETSESVVVLRHHWPVLLRAEAGSQLPDSYCAGLGPDQIEVRLDGAPLTVTAVGPRPLPRTHALLIDTSSSMQPRLAEARRAATGYIRALDPQDAVLVASFNESMVLGTPATHDRGSALDAVERLDTGHNTALWQALYYLLLHLETVPGERVVLLVTDGEDSSGGRGRQFDQVLEVATTTPNLSIYSVGIDLPRVLRVGMTTARGKLGMLSRRTGGQFFELERSRIDKLDTIFRRVQDRLDETLYVSYVPPPGAGRSMGGKLHIRARTDLPCRVVPLGSLTRLDSRRPGASADLEIVALDPADPTPIDIVRECLLPGGEPRLTHRLSLFRAETVAGSDAWLYLTESRRALFGHATDYAFEGGPLFDARTYRETGKLRNEWKGKPVFEERDIEIITPTVAELRERVTGPAGLLRYMLELDVCAPSPTTETPYRRAPFLVHGETFLELRELIGRALFGSYDDYREWATARAERNVREQLDALRSDLPPELQLTPAQLEAVGAVLHQRAASPDEGRPHIHLVEWLGDLPVREAVRALERDLADALLREDDVEGRVRVESLVEAWPKLQQWFPAAIAARILTPLIPAYDPESGRIGFYRFVLPSPQYLGGRPELVPARPRGFDTVRRLVADRRIAGLLVGHVRLISIGYVPAKRRELAESGCFDPHGEPVGSWSRVDLGLTLDGSDHPLRVSAFWPAPSSRGSEVDEPLCVRVDEEQDGPTAVRELAGRLAEALSVTDLQAMD